MTSLLHALSELDVGSITPNVPLSTLGSWRIGGPANLLAEPQQIAQLCRLVEFAARHAIPVLTIGQGTNLLFDDAGFRGIVIRLGRGFSSCRVDGQTLHAGAGLWVPALARLAQQRGLAGFEHIIGIPGTLGGLLLMNGGSQRRAIGDNLLRLQLIDERGDLIEIAAGDCGFGYRQSNLAGRGILVGAVLWGEPMDPAVIRRNMLSDLRERRRKFPRKLPNCGSVFLSTSAMHASVGPPGAIIEQAGLKGLQIGGARVSRRHANFIINVGGASCTDVLMLIAEIRRRVWNRIGFELHCEVHHVSPGGKIVPADRVAGPRLS